MSWNANNTVWTHGTGEDATILTHLGNGQWSLRLRDLGYDSDELAGSAYILWESTGYASNQGGEDPETITYTYSSNGPGVIYINYNGYANGMTPYNPGASGIITDYTHKIDIAELNPDNPASSSLQAGDMVGLIASIDHQDRNSDEDSTCLVKGVYFEDFDTVSTGSSYITFSKTSGNIPFVNHPTVIWYLSDDEVWQGVGRVGDCYGDNNANLEHTATMGGATYKIRFRQILNSAVPSGISVQTLSGNKGLVTSSTSDFFHSFLNAQYMQVFASGADAEISVAGGTVNMSIIEAYVHEVVGGASGSGGQNIVVRGMDASHNTLATDTETATFDATKYYRVNVAAVGVDHWGWSIDGGSETMMPAGSTFFTVNGSDYSSAGGGGGGGGLLPSGPLEALPYLIVDIKNHSGQVVGIPAGHFTARARWGYVFGATGYKVEYGAAPQSGPPTTWTNAGTQTSRTYEILLNQGSYWFRVTALGVNGDSPTTAPANVWYAQQSDDDDED